MMVIYILEFDNSYYLISIIEGYRIRTYWYWGED